MNDKTKERPWCVLLKKDIRSSSFCHTTSVTKKSPNVYNSCLKMIDINIFTKLLKNVGDLDKLIVANSIKKLP